jgi:hypothetical protein
MEMAEAEELLEQAEILNNELEFYCRHTGGCRSDETPCQ